jgi:hypothetical protein
LRCRPSSDDPWAQVLGKVRDGIDTVTDGIRDVFGRLDPRPAARVP